MPRNGWMTGLRVAIAMIAPIVPATATPALAGEIAWQTDYGRAVGAAESQRRMLFIFFYDPSDQRLAPHFEKQVLGEAEVAGRLHNYVCLKLPRDATIQVKGRPLRLLEHPAMRDMQGRQGVAILDYTDPSAAHYGRVVMALPFTDTHCYSVRQMLVALDLPRGDRETRRRHFAEPLLRLLPGGRRPEGQGDMPTPRAPTEPAIAVAWMDDYTAAVATARQRKKMLLVYFDAPAGDAPADRFERETLSDPQVRRKLSEYVCVRVPLDAQVVDGHRSVVLLRHPAFREMLGRGGVAIVDYAHAEAAYSGQVVSTFPLTEQLAYPPERMKVILDLPPGTLTQRTLIYAVRIHPEHPKSTDGTADPYLLAQAESHSRYQARIRLQGHHHWESRFHQINAHLPGGLTAREVCAESWPGQNLVEAAIECVDSWRHSSGHWGAVRTYHLVYGYDMKRGSNGIWYATGIFADR